MFVYEGPAIMNRVYDPIAWSCPDQVITFDKGVHTCSKTTLCRVYHRYKSQILPQPDYILCWVYHKQKSQILPRFTTNTKARFYQGLPQIQKLDSTIARLYCIGFITNRKPRFQSPSVVLLLFVPNSFCTHSTLLRKQNT